MNSAQEKGGEERRDDVDWGGLERLLIARRGAQETRYIANSPGFEIINAHTGSISR